MSEPVEPAAPIVVTIERSGGIAGLTRTWRIERAAAPAWLHLLDRCPWQEVPDDPADVPADAGGGADRFVWRITAVHGAEVRTAALAANAVDGHWRELVDAVRSGDAGAAPGGSAASAEQ